MQNLSMHRHCFFFWMLFWKAPKASKEPESFCGCQSIPSRLDAFAGQCRMSCRCCSGGNRIKESGQRPTSVTIIPLFLAETLYWSRTSLVRPEVSVQRPFVMSWLLSLKRLLSKWLETHGPYIRICLTQSNFTMAMHRARFEMDVSGQVWAQKAVGSFLHPDGLHLLS